jgi:NAD(P)-dependent dehydrogenase (short-subunit alcohol dehydrogenase family)
MNQPASSATSQQTAGIRALQGQTALITGGGRGLGRAIALTLASAGMAIALAARSQEQLAETVALIEQEGGQAVAFPVDVTDRSAVEQMAAEVQRLLGPVDLLFNNAGVLGPAGPVWETDPDEWWRCWDINLRGVFLCARAFLPSMLARRRGRILNMASGAGLAPIPYATAYATNKAALIRFSEILALETAAAGISVFSVDPGTVRTEMADHVYYSEEGRRWLPWFQAIYDEGRDVPASRVCQLTLDVALGKVDALSGCLLRVTYDLNAMIAQADAVKQGELYTLRMRTLEH